MNIKFFAKSNGFSLVELLIVVGIVTIVAAGAAVLFSSGSAAWFSTEGQIRLQENIRKVTQKVSQELRQTSAVQVMSPDTIRFSIPIICGSDQRLICQQTENLANAPAEFSVNYSPLNGEVGGLVEGDAQVVNWNFTDRSVDDPLIIYYDLGSDIPADTQYAIRAGIDARAPKYWRYEESDVYPGLPEEWTLLGGNSDDITWTSGEIKIFRSGLGLKRYRRLVITESFQADLLEMREFRIINDELVWGAPVTWGCTDTECMLENHKVQYALNDQGQFVRSVLNSAGTVVQHDVWATDITGVQFSQTGSRLNISMAAEVTAADGRILTAQTALSVYLRN